MLSANLFFFRLSPLMVPSAVPCRLAFAISEAHETSSHPMRFRLLTIVSAIHIGMSVFRDSVLFTTNCKLSAAWAAFS